MFVTLVFIGLLAVIITALRLNAAISSANRRLRVLVGGYGDAGLLVEARTRFRQRQQRVETVVDTGTRGVQAAHRSLSGLFGSDREQGAKMYDGVRTFNRRVGKTLSGLFAPGPRRTSERLDDWREGQDTRRRTNSSQAKPGGKIIDQAPTDVEPKSGDRD